MRWIVGLILGGWLLTASAQFGLGLLFQGIQALQGPSFGDAAEMMRQSKELEVMRIEIDRLKRFGRFDEAEALNKRYYELMGSGPLGRMMNESFARQPPGAPQTGSPYRGIKSWAEIGELTTNSLRMARVRMESDWMFDRPSTFFVRPAMIHVQPPEDKPKDDKEPKIPTEALNLMLEGMARMMAKDYDGAEQSFGKANSLAPAWPTISALMRTLDWQRGRLDAAMQRLQSEIEVAEKKDPRSVKMASLLWQRAAMHSEAGAHDKAGEDCERALSIVLAAGADSPEYAAGLNNLGVVLQLTGNAARAIEYYERSISVFQVGTRNAQPDAPLFRMHLSAVAANLGLAYWQLGNLARAKEFFRIAYEERALFEYLTNTLLTERAQLAKAQAIATETYAVITLERAAGTSGLGLQMLFERKATHLELRTRAQAAFRRDTQVQNAPPDTLGRAPDSQSTREQALGQRAENRAPPREQGAVAQENAAIPGTPANAARINAGNVSTLVTQLGMQKTDEERQSFLSRIFGPPDAERREQVIARANRQRADEQVSRQRKEDQDLLREYETVIQERAVLPNTPANAARIADLDRRIQAMQVSMQKRLEQTQNKDRTRQEQQEIATISRQYVNDPKKAAEAITSLHSEQQQARNQTARAERAALYSRVQTSVPKDAVLLEMVRYRPLDPRADLTEEKRWGPARYGTYVIQPESEAQYIDLGEAAPLDRLIAEFRAALANPTSASARDLGRRLDEALMRPVRSRLGNALTLYVAPDGALNLIPMGALVDENGRYLLERYTINYLASGRDLLYLGRNNPARSPAIIIADPAFDEQPAGSTRPADGVVRRSRDFRSTKFDRLAGTAAEARSLKRILPDATVLTGASATETAVKKIAGPRVLHVATHGFFLDDLPDDSEDPMLRSGLVFAGVNAPSSAGDDGVLTALEASNLDLRGTKLVVLSACETGVGDVRNGEGVFGLRRAFVVAGAETLLMSLWPVADDATKDLMTSYYTLLARGETRAEALRQTQLAMLKNPITAHPFFWAAFISSGETGILK